jgi:hypothetical protein
MGTPTRFTYGLATVAKGQPLGNYPLPDPFHTSSDAGFDVTTYANDFFTLGTTTNDWTITGTSSTFAVTNGVGGLALITPGATTTVTTVSAAHQSFQFQASASPNTPGQKFWYLCRIAASAVAGNVAFQFGLANSTSATPTDGIWFVKNAASTSVNLVSRVNSTSTTLATGLVTAAAATYIDVGFYFDGTDLQVFVSDNMVYRVSNATVGSSGTTLTNALLGHIFQITPTATDTLTIDYVLTAQETTR